MGEEGRKEKKPQKKEAVVAEMVKGRRVRNRHRRNKCEGLVCRVQKIRGPNRTMRVKKYRERLG